MTNLRGITCVGLDADDTLWHSETRFQEVHQRFADLIAPHVALDRDDLEARMLATERKNLHLFGYGAKSFTLSLIETAIELTDSTIPAVDIAAIIEFGKELLDHPVELLPGVADALDRLRRGDRRLILISKGDLWHQESKIAASGVGELFDAIEIVSEKDEATIRTILARHQIHPEQFCMVGNSVRSDVLPALSIGARAVHIPYDVTWAHEVVHEPDVDFPVVASLSEFVDLLD